MNTPLPMNTGYVNQVSGLKKYLWHLLDNKTIISQELSSYFAGLSIAKDANMANFILGAEQFIHFANLTPEQRNDCFGDSFRGLHYANDLATQWQQMTGEKINPNELYGIVPDEWEHQINNDDAKITLIFRGNNPAKALDNLLKGPAVIDCGIFCQLTIWFAIKSLLGTKVFNQLFNKVPLYLTQSMAKPQSPFVTHSSFPLNPFFNNEAMSQDPDTVFLAYVRNHSKYSIKHPGGSLRGQNCVVINGQYNVFDPLLPTKTNLSERQVKERLLAALNLPRDEFDQTKLTGWALRPTLNHPLLKTSLGSLVKLSDELADFQSAQIDSIKTENLSLKFDLARFTLWVRQVLHFDILLPSPEKTETNHLSIRDKFCHCISNKQSVCFVLDSRQDASNAFLFANLKTQLTQENKTLGWINQNELLAWGQGAAVEDLQQALSKKLKLILSANPDVLFLEDFNADVDNHLSALQIWTLEMLYNWFNEHHGKGLLVSTNQPRIWDRGYGMREDEQYVYPTLPSYLSTQFIHSITFPFNANNQLIAPAENECSTTQPTGIYPLYSSNCSLFFNQKMLNDTLREKLIAKRHQSLALQKEYDQRYGLTLSQ